MDKTEKAVRVRDKKPLDVDNLLNKLIKQTEYAEKRRKAEEEVKKRLHNELDSKTKQINKVDSETVTLNKKINHLNVEMSGQIKEINKIKEALSNEENNAVTQENVRRMLTRTCASFASFTSMKPKLSRNAVVKLCRAIGMKKKLLKRNKQKVQLKVMNQELHNRKKELQNVKNKLKDITSSCNKVRKEKNELQTRIYRLKEKYKENLVKLKNLSSELSPIKQNIGNKDGIISKKKFQIESLKFDLQKLQTFIKCGAVDSKELNDQISANEKEKAFINNLISKGENVRVAYLAEIDKLRLENSIEVTVMQRRTEELVLLYSKEDLMVQMMSHVDNINKQRIVDIALLKTEISKLEAENKILSQTIESKKNLKNEKIMLQKEMLLEKQKCCALEDEMKKPFNVHYWRILKGEDPDIIDLIEKVQVIQATYSQIKSKHDSLKEELARAKLSYMNKIKAQNSVAVAQHEIEELNRVTRNKALQNQRLSAELANYEIDSKRANKHLADAKKYSMEKKKSYYELKRRYDWNATGNAVNASDKMIMSNV